MRKLKRLTHRIKSRTVHVLRRRTRKKGKRSDEKEYSLTTVLDHLCGRSWPIVTLESDQDPN